MSLQLEHQKYTRIEWTTVPSHIKIINYLRDKDIKTVVDIGANVGELSKIFLETISSIEAIYAYEPRSDNFEFMKNEFISEQRMTVIKKGIFYGKTTSPLFFNGGSGSSTVSDFGSKRSSEIGKHYTEIIDLVELETEGLGDIDLVKIDIEGAEYNVLKYSDLIKSAKYLIIEFHPYGMEDVDSFIYDLPSDHDLRVLYVKKFTDAFINNNLPNYKMIVEDEVQYLLERNDNV